MAQCEKCGRSDRVVSKTTRYWSSAISWTVGSIFMFLIAYKMTVENNENYIKITLWVVFATVLMMAINLWRKTFKGKTYIEHECKACGYKWSEGYSRS